MTSYASSEKGSRRVRSDRKKDNWLLLDKGAVVEAKYKEAELPKFKNHPFIQALPLINTREKVIQLLQRYPEYDNTMRLLPAHLRSHQVMDLLRFFQPLPIHLKLEGMVSRMIREGYLARNPMDKEYAGDLSDRLDCFRNRRTFKQKNVPTAAGFAMPGISGMGKSTGMREVLQTYPQIIIHSQYQGRDMPQYQVVWLKLECPKSGASVKALCLSFFEALDDILDTTYAEDYGNRRRNVEDLMQSMAIVASIHGLGVLVLDEVQNLSASKSGGAEEMLNFFVQLVNTIGLPVVLIGTFKAIPILSESFRQARRGSGQGDLVWDRMSFDDDWHVFIETMWQLQYVAQNSPLTFEVSQALHEVSYGITDLAIRIYMAAQWRAIDTGLEEITEELIRSAYRDDFRLISRIFGLLETADIRALSEIDDLIPPASIPIAQSSLQKPPLNSKQPMLDSPVVLGTSGSSKLSNKEKKNKASNSNTGRQAEISAAERLTDTNQGSDLREAVTLGSTAKTPLNAYQSLLRHGYIRPATEFA
jgi:hypothetical protein